MRLITPVVTVLSLSIAASALSADARPGLTNENEITTGIMSVGIANRIRKKCDGISARMVKAYFYMNKLEKQARDLGYTKAEIDAFLSDESEEDKIKARGIAYLQSRGVVYDDLQSLCAFGHEEIKKSSLIGSFLRAN